LDVVVCLRHLPLFDVPVFVEIRLKRYRCSSWAGTPTTQRCAWDELRSPNSKAYEPWASRLLIHSTVVDAARKLGISEETIDGILGPRIERACTDMYEGFVTALEAEVPWAEIVIDRFHVARACRSGADAVHEKELKRVLPKVGYAELRGRCGRFASGL
jgi:transposase